MSDDNDSGGIIGTIISILILAAIWPYLLALLGIYIAYIVALAILSWITENWLITLAIVVGVLSIYCIFRYKLIEKIWRYLFSKNQEKPTKVLLEGLLERKFIPSTNLYCYWCAKKLGIDASEKDGKFYCSSCCEKLAK
jgi:hypothetical protein